MSEFRRVTSQGRIVIPQGYLDELNLAVGDHVRVDLDTDPSGKKSLILRKVA